jgi:hypothetical protein
MKKVFEYYLKKKKKKKKKWGEKPPTAGNPSAKSAICPTKTSAQCVLTSEWNRTENASVRLVTTRTKTPNNAKVSAKNSRKFKNNNDISLKSLPFFLWQLPWTRLESMRQELLINF